MYGIPNPNPLKTNNKPIHTTTIGVNWFTFARNFVGIRLPTYTTAVIRGMVPMPKRNIYKLPAPALGIVKAPKTAIYTKPQGKKPFKKPMV